MALSYCLPLLCHSFCFAQFSTFQTWVCLVLLTDPASQGQGLVSPFLLPCLMGCLARGRQLGPDSSVWGVLPSPEELISLLALCHMPAVPQYPERPDMVEMPISCLVLPLILRTLVLTKGEGSHSAPGCQAGSLLCPSVGQVWVFVNHKCILGGTTEGLLANCICAWYVLAVLLPPTCAMWEIPVMFPIYR